VFTLIWIRRAPHLIRLSSDGQAIVDNYERNFPFYQPFCFHHGANYPSMLGAWR